MTSEGGVLAGAEVSGAGSSEQYQLKGLEMPASQFEAGFSSSGRIMLVLRALQSPVVGGRQAGCRGQIGPN